jgi:Ca2+-binding RTX toxin-like protein
MAKPTKTITGTDNVDSLVGITKPDKTADKIVGNGGSDTIDGLAGNDILVGDYDDVSTGQANIEGGNYNDTIHGGGKETIPKGKSSDDDLLIGDNRIASTGYTDSSDQGNLSTVAGNIYGGDDQLYGERGTDTLVGDTQNASTYTSAFVYDSFIPEPPTGTSESFNATLPAVTSWAALTFSTAEAAATR